MMPQLRTLQGQATLFAVTTVLAAGLAAFLAFQTSFFEGYVVQKFGEPTVAAAAAAADVLAGQASFTEETAEQAYAVWMTADGLADLSALSEADAALIRRLVMRTVVSGTPEQRLRAVRLWETTDARDGLRAEAIAYAERLGRTDVLAVLEPAG